MPAFVRWARVVADRTMLPRIFRDFWPEAPVGGFSYAVYQPADRWGFRKAPPAFLGLDGERLHHLELGRGGVIRKIFSLAGIVRLEMGRVLLHSWIRIVGIIDGRMETAYLEYNSAAGDLVRPLTDAVRRAAAGISREGAAAPNDGRAKLESLRETSFKFTNFANMSIIPGEKVLDAVYDPGGTRRPRMGARALEPAHLAMLTDREFISIEDGCRRHAGLSYGGIWNYVPLGAIEAVDIEGDASDGPILALRLPGGECLRSHFSAGNGEGLMRLKECLEARILILHGADHGPGESSFPRGIWPPCGGPP